MPPSLRIRVFSFSAAFAWVTSSDWIFICSGAMRWKCRLTPAGYSDLPAFSQKIFGYFLSNAGGGSYDYGSFHNGIWLNG